MALELQAVSIGARAARLLGSREDWRVVAVFDRSFYVRSDEAFVCVGDPGIGNGPLNVVTRHLPAASIGASCRIDTWAATVWHAALPREGAGETAALLAAAIKAAPRESFIHAITDREPQSPIERRALAGIASLRQGEFDAAVTTLAGLGHGLTPSGDDVLAGSLLMLHAAGRAAQAAALADAVRRIAPARTSPLSYALLEPACDGEPGEAIAHAITALRTAQPPEAVLRPIAGIGATSGFDLLAGILVAARI